MSQIKRDILIRVRWLYVIFIFIGVLIVGRIVYIQFGPEGDELRSKSRKITFERVVVEAQRGDILARDGRLLATSVPTYEIRMDFAAAGLADSVFSKGVDSLAYRLSAFFGDRSKERYKSLLTTAHANKSRNRYTLISPRRVNFLELKQVEKFPIFRLGQNKGGFILVQVNIRLRPNGSLAARTIGFVNESGARVGIEGAFDDNLRGEDGSLLMQRISGSFRVPVGGETTVEPVNGIDVETTLDVDIQDVAETALKQQLALGKANWGTAVLMEASTGEIRAMANITRRGDGSFAEDYNYAAAMNLEPGSTFKLATLIALLDDGKMELDHMIDCENGRARVGRVTVVDSHKESVISLRRVFEVSSNIGFAKAVNDVYASDPKRFTDFVSSLGFYDPLGIQISGEPDPVAWRPGEGMWSGQTLTMMSYGYGFDITPLHTLTFYNAVANNGRMMRPLLVTGLKEYGQSVKNFQPEVLNSSICSKQTLAKARECLEGVVDEGTASLLKNPYYKVAAKTGTAQIAQGNRGYTDAMGGRHYLATIVGYFPADAPRYTLIVGIKTYYGMGNYGNYYGASLAGPVFRAIADRVYAQETSWQPAVDQDREPSQVPVPIKSGASREIKRVADKLSVPVKSGRNVGLWAQVVRDSLGTHLENVALEPGVVPPVKGMGLKEAIYLLEKSGLKVGFSGKGKVASQSIAPGEKVPRGTFIAIELK